MNSSFKVLVKTPVSQYSGYGSDGIFMCRALIQWGADVYLQPMAVDPPLPPDIAHLLTKHLQAPFDLIINHTDPMQIQASKAMKEASDCVVGWTMWESSSFDQMDPPKAKETFEKRLSLFDYVFVYDRVCAEAIKPFYSSPLVLQGGYDPVEWPYMDREWFQGPFRFVLQGALHYRKNALVAIEAFKELKDEYGDELDMEIHCKTVSSGYLHEKMEEWCPGLFIYREVWEDAQLKDFYSRMHMMLCPSRGEGKNLPALQFLSTGGGCAATNWSGHQMWISSEYAYPLEYELKPIDFESKLNESEFPNCLQADVNKEDLKRVMLHAVRHRGEVKRKGELASRTIPQMCSWTSVFEKLFRKLGENGHPLVRDKALFCRLDPERGEENHSQRLMSL